MRKIGLIFRTNRTGIKILTVREDAPYVRLCYDYTDYSYKLESIPEGILYCVVNNELSQAKLWDAYDKCSMDVSVRRNKNEL